MAPALPPGVDRVEAEAHRVARRAQREKALEAGSRVRRVMTQPINLIFRFLQKKQRVSIWLYEQTTTRIEGRICVSPTPRLSCKRWGAAKGDRALESLGIHRPAPCFLGGDPVFTVVAGI